MVIIFMVAYYKLSGVIADVVLILNVILIMGALAGLKLVVYEHSSVARDILPEILAGLGAEVIRVGRSESFVPVDTEAVEEPEESTDQGDTVL